MLNIYDRLYQYYEQRICGLNAAIAGGADIKSIAREADIASEELYNILEDLRGLLKEGGSCLR